MINTDHIISFMNLLLQKGSYIMKRSLNLLFGITGGLFLILLSPAHTLYKAVGDLFIGLQFISYIAQTLFVVLSLIGVGSVVYFSILLIIDSIKLVHKK